MHLDETYHKMGNCKLLKVVDEEILRELTDRQMIEKAYSTLVDCLNSEKKSDRVAAAQAILKFKEGVIIHQIEYTPDEHQEINRLKGIYHLM